MPEDLFDHVTPTIATLWCPRFEQRHDFHLAAALWTTQGVHFAGLFVDRARLISIAHVWLQRAGAATEASSLDGSADASTSAFLRMPRDLLEYQPPL